MKSKGLMMVVAIFLAATAGQALAQSCPNPNAINCGVFVTSSIQADGPTNFDTYGCLSGGQQALGAERYFLYHLAEATELTINVTVDSDTLSAAVAILPYVSSACDAANPVACIDAIAYQQTGTIKRVLPAGDYVVIVDAKLADQWGGFRVTSSCNSACAGCLDGDLDGSFGYDETTCPCGDDCDDANPGSHPGAAEICGDGIDQDCSGADVVCPTCSVAATVACGDTPALSTADGAATLDSYCAGGVTGLTGKESILKFSPASAGPVEVAVADAAAEPLAAVAFLDFGGVDSCNKDQCVDRALLQDSVSQKVAFWAEPGRTYFIAVDRSTGAEGPFSASVACPTQACAAATALFCDTDTAGSTAAGASNLSAYPDLLEHQLGPDATYSISTPQNGMVTATLTITPGAPTPDLALFAIADDGLGGCAPADLIGLSDTANATEVVTFATTAGATYYLVVDGREITDAGAYTIRADCNLSCPDGQTSCGGSCVDTATDPLNCNACGNVCAFDHAAALCVASVCQMGACATGFDDCDLDAQSCEADLATVEHCGDCQTACAVANGTARCEAAACAIDTCTGPYEDCDTQYATGCESNSQTDSSNCGACGTDCTALGRFCYLGGCVAECPGGMKLCDGDCIDTTGDPQNCGDCGVTCAVANGVAACVAGACVVDSCTGAYRDCDQTYATGCEINSGTDLANCGTCGTTCSVLNGTAACTTGSCAVAGCTGSYKDCDTQVATGCEANTQTDLQHCGTCGNACTGGQTCTSGSCFTPCHDNDSDGYDDSGCGGNDCNDDNAGIHPGATEVCGNGIDEDCSGADLPCGCKDEDSDGYQDLGCGGNDCNDTNGYIHPGAAEICGNGVDEDCSGADLTCQCGDQDGDGYPDVRCGGTDCDDSNPNIYPGAPETCDDLIDQNCDGQDRPCSADSGGCGCGAAPQAGSSLALLIAALVLVTTRRRLA